MQLRLPCRNGVVGVASVEGHPDMCVGTTPLLHCYLDSLAVRSWSRALLSPAVIISGSACRAHGLGGQCFLGRVLFVALVRIFFGAAKCALVA